MEDKDLGSKKINNQQKVNEGFSGENIPEDYNPSASIMNPETETDRDGNKKSVNRARNVEKSDINPSPADIPLTENLSKKMVENKDFNSDIVPNRHPHSNPDNKGNIKFESD